MLLGQLHFRVLHVLELLCIAGVASNKTIRPCWSLGSRSRSNGCENVKGIFKCVPTFDDELTSRI